MMIFFVTPPRRRFFALFAPSLRLLFFAALAAAATLLLDMIMLVHTEFCPFFMRSFFASPLFHFAVITPCRRSYASMPFSPPSLTPTYKMPPLPLFSLLLLMLFLQNSE